MNVNQLSKRLTNVALKLPRGAFFADIGSDHAYLPCYVCLNDPSAKAIAGEVNHGPYKSAWKEVENHDLEGRIDVRLGNGLHVLNNNEVRQVVIAGMGGPLIRDILESGKEKLSETERIIAQPNIDARSVRQWFFRNGYDLVDEVILEENGHIYEILVGDRGEPAASYDSSQLEKQLWLGPHLLKKAEEVFLRKCKMELEKKEYVLSQVKQASVVNEEKILQLQKEISWLKEATE
ncbi:tRNA (adenine(22)-N(1))-methyltransferase [Halobacillus halophilus]|uniref:tRNA (adenine(22)-N(1))-methyltransferase n=1 Tax=Halobacillus halophilus TaxID=1570 RepID=UPI001CD41263|nr:tRNA (adenine(22)-N(1))-methyltransferase TrmK [Halobacillus halophilus]MCA1009704.1 tRNA (adenine(22)-N(1))-methyltransferase TrmK [Halobacillus halophilus]